MKMAISLRKWRSKQLCHLFVCLLTISLSICAQLTYSGDFKLVKVGSHYEPELTKKPGVILPNTSIMAGSYVYVADNGVEVGRLGFMVGDNKFYYVDSSEYALSGDTNYGIYGDYFVIDAWGYGSASGHNRLMFLCQFDTTVVKLLDVIRQAYVESYGLDFVSESVTSGSVVNVTTAVANRPSWIDIRDVDHNGMPEIKLRISGLNFFLYVEIVNKQLHVNLNPVLYAPLFDEEKQKSGTSEKKSDAYYIYGFLAKKLELKEIKLALKQNKERSTILVTLLGNLGKWDAAFHDLGDEKFMMKRYDFRRK